MMRAYGIECVKARPDPVLFLVLFLKARPDPVLFRAHVSVLGVSDKIIYLGDT